MDMPHTQKPLYESLLNPYIVNNQWLRWAAAFFIFYFIFGNGLSVSKSVTHSFLDQLEEQNTGLGSLIVNWLLYGILSEFILIASLIFGLIFAYGLVKIKTTWFRRMAIACFIMACCRITLPIMSFFYSFFQQSAVVNIPIMALIDKLFWLVIEAGFDALLPLYIGFVLLKYLSRLKPIHTKI